MINKLLIIKLILVLVLQPVAVVFAGNGDLENQLAASNFGNFVMACEHMNTPDCPGRDICSHVGHAGCDVKSLRILPIAEPGVFKLSITMPPHGKEHFPLAATTPPVRPPRNS